MSVPMRADLHVHSWHSGYNYDLPFAKNADGWTKHLFGGWQTNGVLRLTGGTPFTPKAARKKRETRG